MWSLNNHTREITVLKSTAQQVSPEFSPSSILYRKKSHLKYGDVLHCRNAIVGTTSFNTSMQHQLPGPSITFKVVLCLQICSLTLVQVFHYIKTSKEGRRSRDYLQQGWQWLITGTFTLITRWAVEVVISGQWEVWKQAAGHYVGEKLQRKH